MDFGVGKIHGGNHQKIAFVITADHSARSWFRESPTKKIQYLEVGNWPGGCEQLFLGAQTNVCSFTFVAETARSRYPDRPIACYARS